MHTHTQICPPTKITCPLGSFLGILWLETNIIGAEVSVSAGTPPPFAPSPPPFLGRGEDYTIPTPTSHSLSSGVRGVMWSLMWSGGSGGVEPGSSSALAQSRDLRGHTKAGIDPGRAWWWNLPPPMILIPDKDCWGGRRRRRRRRKGLREEW